MNLTSSAASLITLGIIFGVIPALMAAALYGWRSPAIVGSGVHALGTVDQRRAAVARLGP
jgi:hypothetical protein